MIERRCQGREPGAVKSASRLGLLDDERMQLRELSVAQTVFPLWDPANPLRSVDVFIDEPIAFDQLLQQAVIKDLDGLTVRVASIPHLII